MHNETVTVRGRLALQLIDPASGRVTAERICHNLVLASGLAWLAGRAAGAAGLMGISAIAVGTGSAAPAAGDVALAAEIDRADLMMAPWQGQGSDRASLYARASFGTAEAVGTLAEAGLYSGSVLCARVLISPTLAKTGDKVLVAQWTISLAAA